MTRAEKDAGISPDRDRYAGFLRVFSIGLLHGWRLGFGGSGLFVALVIDQLAFPARQFLITIARRRWLGVARHLITSNPEPLHMRTVYRSLFVPSRDCQIAVAFGLLATTDNAPDEP